MSVWMWEISGFPHTGWVYVRDEFIGSNSTRVVRGRIVVAPSITCDACGKAICRWASVIRHPEYPGTLRVHGACCEKLTKPRSKKR
jgi:hypothetical protein